MEAKKETLRILQVQLRVPEDGARALEVAEQACRDAAETGVDLVTLPEMFCCQYESARFPVEAQPEGGAVWQRCAAMARSCGVYLSAGSVPERGEDGRIYNTAYVFDRQGRQIAKHRKAHLFDIDVKGGQSFRESDTLSRGDAVTVFDTEFGRMGLCVCYDVRFPELVRRMALSGAGVILVPGAFNLTTGPLHWELTFRAEAMFGQCYTVGTAPARDMEAAYHSWGHSIAVDPWGRVVAQMDEKEGRQLVELDLREIAAAREQIPLLRHRRPALYGPEQS